MLKIMADLQPFSISFRLTILVLMFVLCLWFEQKKPLRKTTQGKARRVLMNLEIAAISAIFLRLLFYPIVLLISAWSHREEVGILSYFKLPVAMHLVIAILALDYTFYFWHWLNHKVPFLWRFHNVHHVDLDLDVSTASRFHFGELIMSTGFRSGQILLLGIDPFTLILFETLITTSAQFHHSNIKLPKKFERYLNKFLVTPRMHGIHHSIVREETDSNFSTIFSFWDRIHKSLKLHIPQDMITIGVASYRRPRETSFINSLVIPFNKQRPWRLPDGTVPRREYKTTKSSFP
jgi:sterol desaturase/sphingolipid hydroxylase (fatty acid hydroxylase superfamily)